MYFIWKGRRVYLLTYSLPFHEFATSFEAPVIVMRVGLDYHYILETL